MKRYKILSIICLIFVTVFCLSACGETEKEDTRARYEVLSGSMTPAINIGDYVIIEPKETYIVGDIVKFDDNEISLVHRIVAIFEEEGVVYYICHGDAVQNVDGTDSDSAWQDDADYLEGLIFEGKTSDEIKDICGGVIQIIVQSQIEGVVADIISI